MTSKAGKSKKLHAPIPPPQPPITVQQCLMWPEAERKTKKKQAGGTGKQKPVAPKITSKDGGTPAIVANGPKPCCQLGGHFELPKDKEEEKNSVDTSGTVSEALRGWPTKKVEPAEIDMDAYYAQNENADCNVDRDADNMREASRAKKATFLPKKKDKKPPVVEVGDPAMGDLMAYRYHREYEEQLRVLNEKENQKKSKQSSEDKAIREQTKLTNNIKANRSGQLRSISLAEKVNQSALDMWQMSKFKNVKAKISSKRCDSNDQSGDEYGCRGYASNGGAHKANGGFCTDEDGYPHGMDVPENQATPPAGYYQDGGLDSGLSDYGDD